MKATPWPHVAFGNSRIDRQMPDTINPAHNPQALSFALFGLGALTYAKHPEGIIEHQTTKSMKFVNEKILRKRPVDDDDVDTDSDTVPAPA